MWFVKLFAVLGIAYLAVVGLLFVAQARLIFPTYMVPDRRPSLPVTAVPLAIRTPDGERLQGIHLPPSYPAKGEKIVVLGFGGNAWHMQGLVLDLQQHFPDRDIVAWPSSGSPSAAALLADSLLIYDDIRQAIGPARFIAVGYSLGGGVAAYLARERSLDGLILVTAFDSLEAVARDRFPWVPVHWLFREPMTTADYLRGLTVPTALISAGQDEVVPAARTAALRESISHLVLDRTIPGAGHNDIFHHPDFASAMTAALAAIVADPPVSSAEPPTSAPPASAPPASAPPASAPPTSAPRTSPR
jgi:pimeloyl-ACP methyl ester carboxylesterase